MIDDSPLLSPDTLLPSQWADIHGRAGDDPIKSLLFALLKISLEDLVGARRPAKRRRWNALKSPRAIAHAKARRSQRAKALRRDARMWIFGDDDGPFSFRTCVESLEIDGEKLRARVRSRAGGCLVDARDL